MLLELVVSDLALFEQASLAFGPGLNVLTGETGAGKSLLVGALELLSGARPRPNSVRVGASQARVEGRFAPPPGADGERLVRWLRKHLPQVLSDWKGLAGGEERELILGRALSSDGRTRAYVNQRPVTRGLLAELAPRLFEVHGQNERQRLFEPAEQLRLLDGYGGLESQVASYREARAGWLAMVERARRLAQGEASRRDRLDLARFQKRELEAAGLEPDERARLEPEREMLRHAENLKGGLSNLVDELAEDDGALLDRLRRADRFLSMWREQVAALGAPAEELASALVHLEEAARELRTLTDRLEVDPQRLELVEGRLAEIERLERKYQLDARGLVERSRELEAEIERLEAEESSLEGLEQATATARKALLERGAELRRGRKSLRAGLVRAVHERFKELGLERARFDLRLGQRGEEDGTLGGGRGSGLAGEDVRTEAERAPIADRELFGERGMDRIEFLLAANPGEGLLRLRQCASGGETARIMLALRGVLAQEGAGRTLLFDEIDSGVGGRLGPVVGGHLRQLAQRHQVLCVTHLPAVAAAAARHIVVRKAVAGGRTRAEVEELTGEARVVELADMIAGGSDQETARAEARRLLATVTNDRG